MTELELTHFSSTYEWRRVTIPLIFGAAFARDWEKGITETGK